MKLRMADHRQPLTLLARTAALAWSALRALGRALFAVLVYVLDVLNAAGGRDIGL